MSVKANRHDAANGSKRIPDIEVMVRFVEAMFRNARRDGWVSFRVFRDNGRSERPDHIQSVRLDDHEFVQLMTIPAQQAANWYRTSGVRSAGGDVQGPTSNAKTDNIREGVALSVECDQNPSAARHTLEALLGPATVVVESGGEWTNPETGEIEPKVHLHWRLKKPAATLEELAVLYDARSLAATLVGGDRTNISIVHPIRWPGSWHCKKTPKLARIAALSADTEIDLEDALNILRKETGATEPIRPHAVNGSGQRTGRRSVRCCLGSGGDPERQRSPGREGQFRPRLGILELDRDDDLGLDRRLGGRAAGVS